jgi:hypothetical protein
MWEKGVWGRHGVALQWRVRGTVDVASRAWGCRLFEIKAWYADFSCMRHHGGF